MTTAHILAIERHVLRAWPAAVIEELDGWRLRFAQGVTGRANSVWPNADHGRFSLDAKIEQAEAFYRARGLPARFQITPAAQPAALDEALAARGYRNVAPTLVQTAVLPPSDAPAPAHTAVLHAVLRDDWFDFAAQTGGYDAHTAGVRRAILQRIALPKAFARVDVDGRLAGIGLGVAGDGLLGVFGMVTRPDLRRSGVATAVLRALLRWGAAQGAESAYLQVVAANAPAQALYRRAGFTTLYAYHYRIQD